MKGSKNYNLLFGIAIVANIKNVLAGAFFMCPFLTFSTYIAPIFHLVCLCYAIGFHANKIIISLIFVATRLISFLIAVKGMFRSRTHKNR